jgi:hypothetical protein
MQSFNANTGGIYSNHCVLKDWNKFEMYNHMYDESTVKMQ